ncbi:FAD-dependent urate hydroxylase-like [Quillaja saponaria]|uniref:FAD-dependent urate hydroxylase-like n=1 Tax=Quillaja saponaria TaxID=32244 RepID=A0AAD7PT08_QUISA|nr:FAD-dependent urate hydroxylase-like [Quillaja saponaria]
MEGKVEDVVIVGAGIAGLTTSLGLYRQGVRSLVLESSDTLRITGFALTTWTNAWRALDAVGIGEFLRRQHDQIFGNVATSLITGRQTTDTSFKAEAKFANHEIRCVKRKLMLEALAKELPSGTIRYSSKVVSIEESGFLKLVHLADGTILETKMLIACDGVNSVVAKWLGFKKPSFTGRSAIRGFSESKIRHEFEPKFMQFFGKGVRSGAIPCGDRGIYWFLTWTPTSQESEQEDNPSKMKQLVLKKLEKLPNKLRVYIENTELEGFISSPLRYRRPWELLWGHINKGNVCVAGDALHPMTPDIGQGGCAALEDGVTLARCLAEAFSKKQRGEIGDRDEEEDQYKRIETGMKKYAKERRWRSISLISTSNMVGFFQQSDSKVITFLRDKFLASFLASLLLKRADFDCGILSRP